MAVKGETVNVPHAEGKLTSYWLLSHALYFTLTEIAAGEGVKTKGLFLPLLDRCFQKANPLTPGNSFPHMHIPFVS